MEGSRGSERVTAPGARCIAGAQNRLLNDYVDERGCLLWGSHAVRSPLGSGVLSAPQDTAVLLWAVNTSGHWVLLGEVQARVCRESRKWPCPSQMPPPSGVRGLLSEARGCVPAGGGWGARGGPATHPLGCAVACSLSHTRSLSFSLSLYPASLLTCTHIILRP